MPFLLMCILESIMVPWLKPSNRIQAYSTTASKLQVKDIPLGTDGATLLCDTSTRRARPIIPASCRCQVFGSIHGLAYHSIHPTQKLIASKLIWDGLQKQIGVGPNNVLLDSRPRFRHIHLPRPASRSSGSQVSNLTTSM